MSVSFTSCAPLSHVLLPGLGGRVGGGRDDDDVEKDEITRRGWHLGSNRSNARDGGDLVIVLFDVLLVHRKVASAEPEGKSYHNIMMYSV